MAVLKFEKYDNEKAALAAEEDAIDLLIPLQVGSAEAARRGSVLIYIPKDNTGEGEYELEHAEIMHHDPKRRTVLVEVQDDGQGPNENPRAGQVVELPDDTLCYVAPPATSE